MKRITIFLLLIIIVLGTPISLIFFGLLKNNVNNNLLTEFGQNIKLNNAKILKKPNTINVTIKANGAGYVLKVKYDIYNYRSNKIVNINRVGKVV